MANQPLHFMWEGEQLLLKLDLLKLLKSYKTDNKKEYNHEVKLINLNMLWRH